jgi:acetyl esterase
MPTKDAAALDPILQQVLNAMPPRLDIEEELQAARRSLRDLAASTAAWLPDLVNADHVVTGRDGHRIALRVYWPPERAHTPKPLPIVVYCHGGGFALGDIESYEPLCKHHALGSSAIVVSVEYRLAPEHPFPAAVNDVWDATLWVAEHAAELGGDATRIAVAGDSAGGNLAAVLAQLARDAGGPDIVFQLLWYPATTFDFSLPSCTENAQAPILDMTAMQTFTRWYVGDTDLADPPATLAPARANTLAGLPPAYIGVAGHDPLRDDGARYTQLLTAAGVAVQLHNAETLPHGYAYFAGIVPAATEAVDRGIRALRKAIHA